MSPSLLKTMLVKQNKTKEVSEIAGSAHLLSNYIIANKSLQLIENSASRIHTSLFSSSFERENWS
jgi:hypothetical protein